MVQSIVLKNYRSYDSASFEFSGGVSIVIGPNASGKTNLLEAIYLLSLGSSFRVSDKFLIKETNPWARVEGIFDESLRVLKLELDEPKTRKNFEINGVKKARLTYDQTIPVVLFEPDDIRMVGGSPERRREYIDRLLIQTIPTYKKSLLSYGRALKQRNTLLKKKTQPGDLFAWNIILARSAADIVHHRQALVGYLNEHISEVYSSIADSDQKTELTYKTTIHSDNYMNRMLRELERRTALDIERGYTSVGPHRDDLAIHLNGSVAMNSASRGEARTIMLALKVLEMHKLEESRRLQPILLLDDVFSELDGLRRRKLTQYLNNRQSIITTTDADVVGKKFASIAQILSL